MARRARRGRMKVKPYRPARRRNYGLRRRSSLFGKLKWPILVVLFAVIVFVAISVAPAVTKLVTGELNNTSSASGVSSDYALISSDITSSYSDAIAKAEESTSIALLPDDMYEASEEELKEYFDEIKANGITGVALKLKDSDGKVYFENKLAKKLGTLADNLIDIEQMAKTIGDNALQPIAIMDTLCDPIVAENKEYCYKYIDGSSTWLDNSRDRGGKPWVDVASESYREYLLELEETVITAGFNQLIFTSVQYPNVRDLSSIYFDDEYKTDESKQQLLADFADELIAFADENDAKASVMFDGESVVGKNDNLFKGSPITIPVSNSSFVIDSTLLEGTVKIGEKEIKKPLKNLDKLIMAIIDVVDVSTNEIVPIIYADDEYIDDIVEAIEQNEGFAKYIIIDRGIEPKNTDSSEENSFIDDGISSEEE